ncbi:AraC-type DNA-binding protein [Pseudonocardia thermophila]|uniref:AraC-type DNA-binding protein n=2 Tax=Pseudonocardia thermophila TaxID=1848 RepID=A0A1M6Y7D8_PSETH|nr:AraC-type DNA-binding protein [Pseudonocardia thermophila]
MSEYGVLGVRDVDFALDRVPPSPPLAALVERYWRVTWEMPAGRTASVVLLPTPSVNVVLDAGRLAIYGVTHDRFTYTFRGAGRVFGIKFRPAGFLPFLRRPIAGLFGRALPAEQLWGPDATELAVALQAEPSLEGLVALTERFLTARWPEPDPQVELVQRIVAALLHDREITRVEEVAVRFGIPMRTLQRMFARYVGVSPKWVLRRYRLHEAATRLAEDHDRPWAEVAAELGYFDQSHFIRDFTRAIGLTPVAYAQACRRRTAPLSA